MSVNDSGDKRERERERKGVACVLVSNSVFLPLLSVFFFFLGRLRSWVYIFVCKGVEK